jgi:hypothetical protein
MVVSALSAAIDVLFANPNLAVDTVYRPGGVGSGVSVRAIARRADRVGDFGDTRLLAETTVFDIRVSEIATPAESDTIEVDDKVYVIQGEPIRDAERLIWTIEARPA